MILFLDGVAPCPANPVILTQAKGTFGISGSQYKDNMRCSWKIQVEATKVSTVTSPHLWRCTFSAYVCCTGHLV